MSTFRWYHCKPGPATETITVQGAPTRFEAILKLEAVGLDTDGKIKPISDIAPSVQSLKRGRGRQS